MRNNLSSLVSRKRLDFTFRTAQSATRRAFVLRESIGEYHVAEQIGRGACSVVKLGIHKKKLHKVALKIYEKHIFLDPKKKRSVDREIRILSKLNHPNIVKLLEVIDTDKKLVLVLDYIQGKSLYSLTLGRSEKIPESEAKIIFKSLVETLEYCHSKNVTHRDIKLENIMVNSHKSVILIDFGLSTHSFRDKKVKVTSGTPTYMAPEIHSGIESFGPPADIWAAGVALYAMLTGHLPFKAPNKQELANKIEFGIFSIPIGVSSKARKLIENMLEHFPNKRPNASEVLASDWFETRLHRRKLINKKL